MLRFPDRTVIYASASGMHGDCFDADKLAGHALAALNNRRTIVPPVTTLPVPAFSPSDEPALSHFKFEMFTD